MVQKIRYYYITLRGPSSHRIRYRLPILSVARIIVVSRVNACFSKLCLIHLTLASWDQVTLLFGSGQFGAVLLSISPCPGLAKSR